MRSALVAVLFRVGSYDDVLVVVMPFCCLATTSDLARWESCGIPSTWRSPTARQPEGSISPYRRQACQALPSGCRVVALWEVDGMPHPAHPSLTACRCARTIPETCRPARAGTSVKADVESSRGHLGDRPARRGRSSSRRRFGAGRWTMNPANQDYDVGRGWSFAIPRHDLHRSPVHVCVARCQLWTSAGKSWG